MQGTHRENNDETDQPRRVGESLDRLTRSLGGPDAGVLAPLFGRWPELVGDQVAAHARPVTLADGTLVIAVDQPIWRTQLAYLEPELLGRLNAVLGAGSVTRIELRIRPPDGRRRTPMS